MNERGLIDLFTAMNSLVGSAYECKYYPCHFEDQDCSLCFCIFYPCLLYRFGEIVFSHSGKAVWSCKNCFWIHEKDHVEEVITYFSAYPRQFLVEADWYFFNRALQEILFGRELGYSIGEAYNLMPANFYGFNCREARDGSFLAVRIKEGFLELRELKDFEDLRDEILIPQKFAKILRGFDGKGYVECEL
ncbi:MAG: hypothetical protein NZ879_00705 [Archaeoglobaceae archaeon]|nr:hypothetical protein [Archaeoglobaceae archaeon]MDW8117487.1 cysteine-rich small domain-containing protein [Archaeoglobaceae archaeon]